MPDRSRVPIIISEFDAYINTTDNFLQAISSGIIHNWERLGLDTADAAEWHSNRLLWRDDLFKKYSDPLRSTSAAKENLRNFMRDFRKFARGPLNIMAAGKNATSTDENIFRFKRTQSEHTRQTTVIKESVMTELARLGGAVFKFICRMAHGSRAGIHKEANGVQMAYIILDNLRSAAGNLPEPDSSAFSKELSTKAVFVKAFGIENKQKVAAIYMRWYNAKQPHLSGPWSGPLIEVIA